MNKISSFKLEYSFFDELHETELSMFVDEQNILAYERNGKQYTTRWNLDELAFWLRSFLEHMKEDPYPVEIDAEFAAEKDAVAHEFDSEDDDEFDAYYDLLDDWNERHRWHPASAGAILADVYFQLVGDVVEISWNNQDCEDDVVFHNEIGGARIQREEFYSKVNSFLNEYADHWYK